MVNTIDGLKKGPEKERKRREGGVGKRNREEAGDTGREARDGSVHGRAERPEPRKKGHLPEDRPPK